jgi:hypothetical protein
VDWRGYADSLLANVLESVESSPAPFVDALQLLPYPVGLLFLIDRWLSGGQAAIDALYEAPALSFAEWLTVFEPATPIGEAVTCFPTGAPPGYAAFDHDSFGAAGLIGLNVGFGRLGIDLSAGIDGDSMVVFTDPADPAQSRVAAAWRIRFHHALAAEGTARTFTDSRGTANLRATQLDREVLVQVATDPAVLAAWTNGAECGRAEDLPVPPEAASMHAALRGLARSPRRAIR